MISKKEEFLEFTSRLKRLYFIEFDEETSLDFVKASVFFEKEDYGYCLRKLGEDPKLRDRFKIPPGIVLGLCRESRNLRIGDGESNLTVEELAGNAWINVLKALNRCGVYEIIYFDDSNTPAAIEAIGGWGLLSKTPLIDKNGEDNFKWIKKDFIKEYCVISKMRVEKKNYINTTDPRFKLMYEPRIMFIGIPENKEIAQQVRLEIKEEKDFTRNMAIAYTADGDKDKLKKALGVKNEA